MLTYQDAQRMLDTPAGRKLGYRKLERNTYLHPRGDAFAVRLHATDVVTILPDGTYSLNTGGWFTVTTKQRINAYGPARVSSDRGTWIIWSDDDPKTPPAVRKCGRCHGNGRVMADTWGRRSYYRSADYGITNHVHESSGAVFPIGEWEFGHNERFGHANPAPLQRAG